MSENYHRQEIRSVSSSVLPVAAGGLILAAGMITTILSSLSSAAREAHRINSANMPDNKTNAIKPVTALRQNHRTIENPKCILSPAEAVKVSTLISISNSGYLVENTAVIQQKLQKLQSAKTLLEAQDAQNSIIKELKAGHQKLFMKGLTIACAKASVRAGFGTIQTLEKNAGSVQVIASDSQGRALVTEIIASTSQAPKMMTEVVGISDGTCKQIMDNFDRALDEQGIRSTQPKRKFTGGICELTAAKEFVRNNVKRIRTSIVLTKNAKDIEIRRSQRLNQKNKIMQKA